MTHSLRMKKTPSFRHEDQAKEPPQDPTTTDSDNITTSHNNKTPTLEEPSSVDSDKASFCHQYLNNFTLPYSPTGKIKTTLNMKKLHMHLFPQKESITVEDPNITAREEAKRTRNPRTTGTKEK